MEQYIYQNTGIPDQRAEELIALFADVFMKHTELFKGAIDDCIKNGQDVNVSTYDLYADYVALGQNAAEREFAAYCAGGQKDRMDRILKAHYLKAKLINLVSGNIKNPWGL